MRHWKAVLLAVVLCLPLGLGLWTLVSPQTLGGGRGAALMQASALIPQDLRPMRDVVIQAYSEYRANAIRWSFVYYGCLFGSAALSATAGVILKLESTRLQEARRRDVAAVLAAAAALLITLASVGEFEVSWRANRRAAAAAEGLFYDLLTSKVRTDRVVVRLQRIAVERNAEILGLLEETEPDPTQVLPRAPAP